MISQTEATVLNSVSIDEPWSLVESFSTCVREHPDDVNRAMDQVAGRLRHFGVAFTVHEPNLYLSLPGKARIEAGGKSFRAKPPAYGVPASNGLTGELVYVPAHRVDGVGALFERQMDRVGLADRIRGKIVLSEGFANPSFVSEFEALGAVAAIGINAGVDIHWGICTSIWGTPDLDDLPRKPKIPVATVNKPDGEALIAIAEAAGSVTIFTELNEGWFRSKLLVAEIKGSVEPEKFVLVDGHLDSWDVGVGDNAVGDATLLEIARVLSEHRAGLRRSVRIAWWPGHSTGRYAGSAWYADAFALDLEENCVAQVNCDSPGCRWATEFHNLSAMAETVPFITEAINDICGKPIEAERPHRAGDYSFNNIGISSYFMLSSTMSPEDRAAKGYYGVGGCGGNIAWHTENDKLEIADKDNLLRDIKIYLLTVLRNANAEILPFDWRLTTKEFLATIAQYQSKAGDRFDLSPSRRATENLATSLDGFYADVAAKKIPAAKANAAIMALARILVPINFTREARFRHDPALTIPPLPTIATATQLAEFDAHRLGFALTQLTRGQNRLVSALRQAAREVALASA